MPPFVNQQSLRNDRTTHSERQEQVWVEAEFYLYGELTNAGGKSKPNIHLDTKEHGTLRIAVDKDTLNECGAHSPTKVFLVAGQAPLPWSWM